MGFYYSESVGMKEGKTYKHKTKDEAVLQYYLDTREEFGEIIEESQETVQVYKEKLRKLNETFIDLRDKFPEEFL